MRTLGAQPCGVEPPGSGRVRPGFSRLFGFWFLGFGSLFGTSSILVGTTARAQPGSIRVALEPGVANLARPGEQHAWGVLGGVSGSFALASLVGLQFHADHKILLDQPVEVTVSTWGLGIFYFLDVGPVRPFGEVGISGFQRRLQNGPQAPAELTPHLAVGIDLVMFEHLLLGAVVRYYGLAGSEILAPGYSNFAIRLGFAHDFSSPPNPAPATQ